MGLSIKNADVEKLARELARRRDMGVTEVIHAALTEMAERDRARLPLAERLKPLQERIAGAGATGLKADKAFYNALSGEDE
ncbi:MAG: type II toxin-antitoxin system VapB family antitoxin [Beijerinckiaceae bacterium]